ncbi:MAG: hypothetical protein JWO05_1753 [Gemmatimonadetes bacterium]|nr:hypothetical protein [Gemmatimonadota bacterium]
MPSRNSFVACALLLALGASAAGAQVFNQSDVSGGIVTGSEIWSGGYAPPLGSVIRIPTFTTGSAARSFSLNTGLLAVQLNSATLRNQLSLGAGFSNASSSEAMIVAQSTLYDVMTTTEAAGTTLLATERLYAALMRGNDAPNAATETRKLVEALQGMIEIGKTVSPRFFNVTAATQLRSANAAYNALIDSAPDSYIASPPPELVFIRAALLQVTRKD